MLIYPLTDRKLREGILIVGGVATGKTTLLNGAAEELFNAEAASSLIYLGMMGGAMRLANTLPEERIVRVDGDLPRGVIENPIRNNKAVLKGWRFGTERGAEKAASELLINTLLYLPELAAENLRGTLIVVVDELAAQLPQDAGRQADLRRALGASALSAGEGGGIRLLFAIQSFDVIQSSMGRDGLRAFADFRTLVFLKDSSDLHRELIREISAGECRKMPGDLEKGEALVINQSEGSWDVTRLIDVAAAKTLGELTTGTGLLR